MIKIKIAIVGMGNCASALIQGIAYYSKKETGEAIGLMHWNLGGYAPGDIEVVAAFDIDRRKVGRDVGEAIFAKPNCTKVFFPDVPRMGVKVQMGRILDGVAGHMKNYGDDCSFLPSTVKEADSKSVVAALKESGAEVLLNYLPVGSEQAVKFYAQCALDARVAFINNMPVFIASSPDWVAKFSERGLPIIGDDIKSQLGATITHRALAKLFTDRGVKLERTYQLNIGGNTDFLNMLDQNRLKDKRISKTSAVTSVLGQPLESRNIHIGPSDYIPWLQDNKVCFLRMEGKIFGDMPMNIEMRLSVEDSPNSAGVGIDAIRCIKLALKRKQGGVLYGPSAYFMKHPPRQHPDNLAREMVEDFIDGKSRE
ncbi:MAG TPA: inositol-3-phosphate synthase [Patescibacteria group bacterium]|nr:inositol-3-phosphate synthase [Patescibacteria group bacterium]